MVVAEYFVCHHSHSIQWQKHLKTSIEKKEIHHYINKIDASDFNENIMDGLQDRDYQ